MSEEEYGQPKPLEQEVANQQMAKTKNKHFIMAIFFIVFVNCLKKGVIVILFLSTG